MGVPYESESQGELPPPPTYAAVIGGETVEMVETKGDDAKKNEDVSKMDKEKKEDDKEKEEEEGPPVPPPVGLIELVSFIWLLKSPTNVPIPVQIFHTIGRLPCHLWPDCCLWMWIFHAPSLHHIWRHPTGDFQHKSVHTN